MVETLVVHGSHVLAGGFFTSINGSGRNYYASLNSKTGRDDRYLRLRISGHYEFPGADGNRTRVYNQQLNPGGLRLLVEGDFTSVRGKSRQQIFMLSLRGKHRATVTKWRSSDMLITGRASGSQRQPQGLRRRSQRQVRRRIRLCRDLLPAVQLGAR